VLIYACTVNITFLGNIRLLANSPHLLILLSVGKKSAILFQVGRDYGREGAGE